MGKPRVLLALGQVQVEEWIINKLSGRCEFVGQCSYREQILDAINQTMPDVIILDVTLTTSSIQGISIDNLITQIRTKFSNTRPIVICGDQVAGDSMLSTLVDRGVYDIAYGTNVKIMDVCDMIFNPKQYSYAVKLQDKGVVSDKEIGVERTTIVKEVEVVNNSTSNQAVPNTNSSLTFSQAQAVANPNVQQAPKAVPRPEANAEYVQPVQAVQPAQPVTQEQPQTESKIPAPPKARSVYGEYKETAGETTVLSADKMQAGYTKSGHRKDMVLYAAQNMNQQLMTQNSIPGLPAIKQGKIFVVAGARQGVGCTSVAINTAYAHALSGKRVLLIDATFGRSCIYQKLGLPETFENTIEDVVRAFINGNDVSMLTMTKRNMNIIQDRKDSIPDTLEFLRFSEEFNYNENLNQFPALLDRFTKIYDSIIFDTSVCYSYMPVIGEIMVKASKVALVMTQDIYEINTMFEAYMGFNSYIPIASKIIPVLNKAVKRGEPNLNSIKNVYNIERCVEIPYNEYWYMQGYLVGKAPYLFMKSKVQKIFNSLF